MFGFLKSGYDSGTRRDSELVEGHLSHFGNESHRLSRTVFLKRKERWRQNDGLWDKESDGESGRSGEGKQINTETKESRDEEKQINAGFWKSFSHVRHAQTYSGGYAETDIMKSYKKTFSWRENMLHFNFIWMCTQTLIKPYPYVESCFLHHDQSQPNRFNGFYISLAFHRQFCRNENSCSFQTICFSTLKISNLQMLFG